MMRLLIQSLFISILLPPRFECARMKDSTFTGGKIRKDTVLTRTRNSVYYITRNIFVSPRATLTVQAGVTLKIATNVKILIKGALISVGTFHEPITFQGNDEKTDTAADDEHFRMSNKVRLVNGINHNIGLLEISNGNRWEKVCDFLNTWDKTKSMVVCRQLGFWEGERVNLNLKLTGNVSSKLFECQGHETEIGQCVSFGDYFLSNCSSNQLVSLRCKNPLRSKWKGIEINSRADINSRSMLSSVLKYTMIKDSYFAVRSTGMAPEIDHVTVNSIYGFIFRRFTSDILISNSTVKSTLFSVMVKGYRGTSFIDRKRIEFDNCTFSSNDRALSISNVKAWNVPIDIHNCKIKGSASVVQVQSAVNLTFVNMDIKRSLLGRGITFQGCEGRIIISNSSFQYEAGHDSIYPPLKAAIQLKENHEQIYIISCNFQNIILENNLIEIYSTTRPLMTVASNQFSNNECEYLIAGNIVDNMYLFEYTGDPSEFTQVIEIRNNTFTENKANILKTKDYSIYYPPGAELDFFSFWRINGIFVENTVINNVSPRNTNAHLIKLLLAFGNWIVSGNKFIDNKCYTVINLQMGVSLDRTKINYMVPEPFAELSKNLFINNGYRENLTTHDTDLLPFKLSPSTIMVKGNTSSLRITYNILSNPRNKYELIGADNRNPTERRYLLSCNRSNFECLTVNATCNFWGADTKSHCRIFGGSGVINLYYKPTLFINNVNDLPTSVSAVKGECRETNATDVDDDTCESSPSVMHTIKQIAENRRLLHVGVPIIVVFLLLVSIMVAVWCLAKRDGSLMGRMKVFRKKYSSEKISFRYSPNGGTPEIKSMQVQNGGELYANTGNGGDVHIHSMSELSTAETLELVAKPPAKFNSKRVEEINDTEQLNEFFV